MCRFPPPARRRTVPSLTRNSLGAWASGYHEKPRSNRRASGPQLADLLAEHRPGLAGMFTVLLAENLEPDAPLPERFLRRYRDTSAIIGSGIRRGQRAGRYRPDIDPRVKAREIVAFLYGIEASWQLDPSVPVTEVFAEYTRSLAEYPRGCE